MFVGGAGAASDGQPPNLEGGVPFKFNFAFGDDGGRVGEEKVEELQDEKHQGREATATPTRETAPAFEVFPKSFDVSELQVRLEDP